MKQALGGVVTLLALCACGSSSAAPVASTAATGTGTGVAATPVMKVAGVIAANATWSGNVFVTADATINSGVTVTVLPGTAIVITASRSLAVYVKGALDIQGTKAAKVTVAPSAASGHWNRFVIPTGGRLTAHYLVESGGGFNLVGGKVTLIDSAMSRASGDLLEGSGTVDVEYSSIGLESGVADSTHCDMHFNPGHNTLKVTHTNISTAVYGMMFYGGTGADFTYDNWFSNSINVEVLPAYVVGGNFSHGWFSRAVPSGPGIVAAGLSSTRLPVGQAGPRP